MDKSYSHRTLVQKLGIKGGFHVLLINEPEDYRSKLLDVPEDTTIHSFSYEDVLKIEGQFDMIQIFTYSQERLKEILPTLKEVLKKTGMMWITWPKGHCDVRSDMNENIVHKIGLRTGLVDIKVVSVDETWSGLKFVYRLSDRG